MPFQSGPSGPFFIGAALAAAGATAAVALVLKGNFPAGYFLDNDDLMRMLQVRELLDGRAWFDLHEPRLDPPGGLDSHWSRLIDAGIAGLVLLFGLFVDRAAADFAAQFVWPLLWVTPAVLCVAVAGRRLGGELGGLLAAAHAAVSFLPAFVQFRPGRIDHHNVQIVLALAVFACVLGLDGSRRAGRLLGVAVCVLLAIGLESAPFAALGLSIAAVRFVARDTREEFRGLCETVLVLLPALLVLQTPPELLLRARCDALAVNLAAGLAACAALGLVALAVRAGASLPGRAAIAAAGAALAAALIFGLEPRCLAGPFGMENPEIHPLWLARNMEVQPIRFSLNATDFFLLTVSPVLVALLLLATLARARLLPPGKAAVAALFMLVALATALAAVRNIAYPILLASIVIGASLPGLAQVWARFGVLRASALASLFVCSVPMATALIIEAGASKVAAGAVAASPPPTPPPGACDRPEGFAELAALPPARVLASLELGAPILATTRHSVFTAPYHRVSDAIVENLKLMEAGDEEVLAFMHRRGATLVAVCKERGDGVERRLREGRFGPGLEEIPTRGPVGIWRLVPRDPG